MDTSQSSIDQDIEFYRGEKIRLNSEYRRASASDEYAIHVKILLVESIIASLVVYREYVNGEK